MTELISLREAARRIGVSDPAIHKAIKSGRVVIKHRTEKSNRPLVEWPAFLDEWNANSDPMKRAHVGPRTRIVPPPVVQLAVSGDGGAPIDEAPAVKGMETAEVEEPAPAEIVPEPTEPAEVVDPTPKVGQPEAPEAVPVTYADFRKQRERYQAELSRLEYEEKSGSLVSAEEVRREAFRLGRVVRDSLLNIPDRLAAELAGMTNQFQVHRRLTDEIRSALTELGGIE